MGLVRCCQKSVFLFLLLGAIGVLNTSAQDITRQLNQYFSDSGLTGSVIVTYKGNTLLSKGYGMANYESGVANTPETVFRIGSITKQFTAMAILILQDRGLLRVEDTIGIHMLDAPDIWKPLTIHQLLTHTSGIMHSWRLGGFGETMAVPTTLDETLARFHDQPLLFEPGTKWSYSGTGYFLLAKLIEELSGQTYSEFLAETIFEPVGMHNTRMDTQEEVISNRAIGYIKSEEGSITNAPDIYMPILTGGGNMVSTVGDMALWDAALSNHELISDESYEMMYRPDKNNYAYGWFVRDSGDATLLTHTGGVPGFGALISRIPEKKFCLVVLGNQVPRTRSPQQMLDAVLEIIEAQ